jgi:YVTN family beta-propeller protein
MDESESIEQPEIIIEPVVIEKIEQSEIISEPVAIEKIEQSELISHPVAIESIKETDPIGPVQIILNQYGVAITPDEKYLYIVNNKYYGIIQSDSVYVYDLINELIIAKITNDSFKTPSTATISGRRVYITNSNSTTITVIDTATNKVVKVIDGFKNPYRIVVSEDGKTGFICNYGDGLSLGTVSVINLETFVIKKNIQVGLGPCNCALSQNGQKLCVTNYYSQFISIISTSSLNVIKTVPLNSNVGFPFNINIDSNNYCYILSLTLFLSHVSIIDLSTDTLLLPYFNTFGSRYGIVFSSNPNLKQLYLLNYNKNTTLSFIDINNGIPQLLLIQYKNDYTLEYDSNLIQICPVVGNAILTYDKKFLYITTYGTKFSNLNNLVKL